MCRPDSILKPELEVTVSVVMPALNEEGNIAAALQSTLDAFDKLRVAGEIVVIDDGSRDHTGQIAHSFMVRDPRVRILRHEHPHGLGASFWHGVAEARGEMLTWLPGDNENLPEEILRYLNLLDHVDFVVPFVYNKGVRPLGRRALSFAFRQIINLSFGANFNYTNGTIVYRRSVLNQVDHRSTGFLFGADILIRLARRGYLFAEVPYRLQPRSKARSKALSARTLWNVLRDYATLFRHMHLRRPLTGGFPPDSASHRRYRGAEAAPVAPGTVPPP
jgi:glycosyltransferase involved in cell wall biosynthesis